MKLDEKLDDRMIIGGAYEHQCREYTKIYV